MALHCASNESAVVSSSIATTMEGVANLTMGAWMRRNASSGRMSFGQSDDSEHRTVLLLWSDGNMYCSVANGGFPSATVADNDTNWGHHLLRYDGALTDTNRVKYYKNGSFSSNSTSGPPATTYASFVNEFDIGRYRGTSASDGDLGDGALWNVTLTEAEIAQLGAGLCPLLVRPAALAHYWRLVNGTYEDLVGGVNMSTAVGTPSATGHNPIIYPGSAIYLSHEAPAVGGANPKGPLGHPLHGALAGPIGP